MSLRSYLFILIGSLISLLTISQLTMVYWIENNIAKEVDFQARHYSEQIIELAVDQLNQTDEATVIINTDTNNQSIKETIHDSFSEPQLVVQGDKVIIEDISESNQNIEVIDLSNKKIVRKLKVALEKSSAQVLDNLSETKSTADIHQKVKSLVSDLHADKANKSTIDNMAVMITSSDVNLSSPNISHIWQTKSSSPGTASIFKKIQITLLVIGGLGIIFAYWLSIQFNKPLKQLSNGFKKLAQGDYQHQVAEQGVKEIRETMQHFNQMVNRLQTLSLAEKQHKEIAHLAELGEVSRGLAHALRNPIHTIGLSIEQLSDEHLSNEQRQKLILTIGQKIANIDKNIKGLLTLTTAGISRTDKVPVTAVVQDIMLEYKACDNKLIQFELKIPPELSINGAESEIRNILHTLINNACETNESGGKVKIMANSSDSNIEISIIDQGKGLEKHIESQLFQPHISSKPEGAGMGLYIAQRLISLHYNGLITLINNDDENRNKGCVATATFSKAAEE